MDNDKKFRQFTICLLILTVIVVSIIYINYDNSAGSVIMDTELTSDDIIQITINQSDVELIAKTVYGEARGCSVMEQSAVIWCILNRVDAGYGTIKEVITAPYQFAGYNSKHPVKPVFEELARDVLIRWQIEKHCLGNVGRTLPSNYLFFHGDGKHNYFRNAYDGDYDIWEWEFFNPYS